MALVSSHSEHFHFWAFLSPIRPLDLFSDHSPRFTRDTTTPNFTSIKNNRCNKSLKEEFLCWVCVIFFARVVVSERLHRVRRGVRGGVEPPTRGFRGSTPEKKNLGRHIFAGFGPTYYHRADIFPGPHDIRWFLAHGFCRWFSISG